MELLTLEDFSGCVNEPFATRLDDVHLEFVLVEARPLGNGATHPVRQPFSLLFRNTAAHQLVGSLSGGERLRAALACVLSGAQPPKLWAQDKV